MANAPQAAAATQAASRLHEQEARRLTELQGLLPYDNDVVLIACSKAVLACLCDVLVINVTHSAFLQPHILRPGHAVALSAALAGSVLHLSAVSLVPTFTSCLWLCLKQR